MQNKSLLYILIINFVILLLLFGLPIFLDIDNEFFPAVGVSALTFVIFGSVLMFRARKEEGKIKTFLMLTGFSAISPLLFSVLHNFFYALGEIFIDFKYFFEFLHASSFIIAILISPITFTFGAIISLMLSKSRY